MLCQRLPCVVHPLAYSTSALDRAAPFIIGVLILFVSIFTTYEVIKVAETRLLESWTPEQLDEFEPDWSPEGSVLVLAWAVDAAQIPAFLGTPLAGLFILKHSNFMPLYTAILAVGLAVYFIFLQKVAVKKYEDFSVVVLGYRISYLRLSVIGLNALGAVLAAWVLG